METINISSLKTHLSKIINKVKQGATFSILDRDTPVALLTSLKVEDGITYSQLATKPFSPPKGLILNLPISPIDMLREDRDSR